MKKQKNAEFKGTIRFVSCSPHGDPEGIVLDDGSFVKTPPHSLRNKAAIKEGAKVEGMGELLAESPNAVYHHARVNLGDEILADDSNEDERDDLKESHKKEIRSREETKGTKKKITGQIVAVATKPKGEVDRVILKDGTSIHVPKEVKLSADDLEIGSEVEAAGECREFGKQRFLKAEQVRVL